MLTLAEAVRDGRVPNAQIALVVSDKPAAAGLERAREQGLKTIAIPRQGQTRQEHEREILAALREHEIDLVCLAGYMRVLSGEFLNAFSRRILNIHPSLLPLFPGLDAQKQALDNGASLSGCTVHYVDETLDGGPIIAQRVVAIRDDDTVASLSARILVEEHLLYPEAVAKVLSDRKG